MPAVSQAQRGWMAANKGVAWMRRHHFDNKGRLPYHVGTTGRGETRPAKRSRGVRR